MPTEASAKPQSSDNLNAETGSVLTAGEVLQQERLRRGLSEKEVADKLHITMHYVKAIESNSYEKLPGAIFARGYIKSYALLLGMDEDDLVAMYAIYQEKQQAEKDDVSRRRARSKKDRNRPWVIMSVVVFVGGFAGLWAYNNYFAGEAANSSGLNEEVEQQAITSPRQGLLASASSVASTPVASTLVANTPGRAETVSSAVEEPDAAADDEAVAVASEPVAEPAPVDFATALSSLAPPADADGQAPAEEVAPPGETDSDSQLIQVGAAGGDVLRVSFSGESWIEINDSESNPIYRDIRGAGDVLEITGTAPFNILLGDAPFASMSLNGTEIDVSENIRIDNSARLTVGL